VDVWRQVAKDIGGSFEEAARSRPSIRRRAGAWDIVMQQGILTDQAGKKLNDATYLTALIVNSAGLEFTIYREGVGEVLAKLFGLQDIRVGDEKFDRMFICKGNDEKRLCEVFSDARLKSLMLATPDLVLTLSCLRPDRLDTVLRGLMHQFLPDMASDMEASIREKLQSYCEGILNDAGAIKRMFEIFELLLPRLAQLGIVRPPT
jgi:hypothetical protein